MNNAVPEFIDPVFTKTSPKRSFSLYRKRAFWLVFAKTGSIISGTGVGTKREERRKERKRRNQPLPIAVIASGGQFDNANR